MRQREELAERFTMSVFCQSYRVTESDRVDIAVVRVVKS